MKIKNFRYRRRRFSQNGKFFGFFSRLFKKKGSWKKKIGIFFGSIFLIFFLYGTFFLPSVDNADQLAFAQSTIIYDRGALEEGEDPNDHILYVIHGDENREYIPLEEIPQYVKDATLAIEDSSFYRHFGFDVGAILKSTLNHFFGIGRKRGGSTITQQLVKNTFLSRERTITRKFNEILLSIKVEWYYSKDEILELYLNNIPYGNNAHGIEAAAKTFFDKSARELTLIESVILASLPVAPTRFSPHGTNKDLLMGFYEYDESKEDEKIYKKGRKDLVLERMLDLEMITEDEFRKALNQSKEIEFRRAKIDINAPHFVFYVREKMEEKYGKEFLKNGGLRIYTTLDPELQAQAEETIEIKSSYYSKEYGAENVALLSINPDNGQILAYVGGKDFFDVENDGQVDVLTSRRQPGSSFKPFVYATAFTKGYSPSTIVFDVETDFGGNYQPQNFDGKFSGPVSFREALNRSLNIPAVKVAYLATPGNILKLAKKVGIKIEGDASEHGVAIGIGVAEVEPLSHIGAYQVFTGDGTWFEPSAILEVRDSDGIVLEKLDSEKTKKEGIDAEVAALVRNILTDESTRPTTGEGEEAFDWNIFLQLGKYNNGAKTGTSNRKAENPDFDEEKKEDEEENPKIITVPGDSWTIGFTPHLVTGVWVGNNRGKPMKSGATGLTVAAPIWKDFMLKAHEILVENGADSKKLYNEVRPLEMAKINKFSGKIATEFTPKSLAVDEVFASFNVPTQLDDSVKKISIDKRSGLPAGHNTPFYAQVQKFAITGLQSIKSDMPNWQNPVNEWLETHSKFLTSLGTIRDETKSKSFLFGDEKNLSKRSSIRREGGSVVQQNPPRIQILSPKSGGSLARGLVEVNVLTTSKYGTKAVEYYFDDKLVADNALFPWTGRFNIPASIKIGSVHKLKVVVIDERSQSGENEIDVKIEFDTKGPEITFLGPIGKQRVPIGTKMYTLIDAKDESSGTKVVEFFLDDQSLGFIQDFPYEMNFDVLGKLGQHKLKVKAWDYHGNEAEREIPIIYEREKLVNDIKPEITYVHSYRNSISVDVVFPAPELIEWAELILEKDDIILFSKRLNNVTKFAQFQIVKKLIGPAKLQLITKTRNQDKLEKSLIKKVDY